MHKRLMAVIPARAQWLLALLLSVASASSLHAETHCDRQSSADVTQIADGVYLRQGTHGPTFETANLANIGFVIGSQCVAVIDSGSSAAEGQALGCAIANVTDLPVCYLIISHHHYDHSMGSLAFRDIENINIIAHEKFPATMQQSAEYYLEQLTVARGESLTPEHIVLPGQTVATGESLQLDLGDRELLLRAHPPAHTNNDLSVFDNKTGTLWLADLMFLEHIPPLDTGVGTINGWLDVIESLRAEYAAATLVVPGHGPAAPWPAGIGDTARYLAAVRDGVRAIIADGGTMQEAMDSVGVDEKDKWQMFNIHHRRTVNKAFVELEWE